MATCCSPHSYQAGKVCVLLATEAGMPSVTMCLARVMMLGETGAPELS